MAQQQTQPVTWELGMQGGLAPKWYGNKFDIANRHPELLYSGSNLYLSEQTYGDGVCNPLALSGYLSPANATATQSATTLSGLQVDSIFIPDGNNDLLVFLERQNSGGNLILWSGSSHVNALSLTSTVLTPSTQFYIGTDLEIYQVNGVKKIFFAYKDNSGNGGSNVGIFNLAMSSGNFTWLSGTVSGAFTPGANELRMFTADNGFLYIIDGSTLHKVDGTTNGGTNGTVTPNVLVFPAYYILVDGMDARGKAWMTVNRIDVPVTNLALQRAFVTYCGVYVWDRQSIQSQMQDFIPIDGVNYVGHIFQFRGNPCVFTISGENLCQLRQYTGSEFKVIAQAQATDYPLYKGCIQITDQTITWQGQSGNIFVYGRVDPFQYVDGLYKIGRTSNFTGNGSAGSVLLNDYISSPGTPAQEVYRISSGLFVYTWWAHAQVSTSGSTPLFPDTSPISTLVKRLPKLGWFNNLTLFYPPVGTTGTTTVCTVNVFLNNGTSAVATRVLNQTDVLRGFVNIPINKVNANNIRLTFTYNNAVSLPNCPRFSHAELALNESKKKQ